MLQLTCRICLRMNVGDFLQLQTALHGQGIVQPPADKEDIVMPVYYTHLDVYKRQNKLFIDDNALSVNVTRIRNKLRELGVDDFIVTRHRQGYQI